MSTDSIGATARDHSTVQAWEDDIPATLTETETGECYNDAEFTSATQLLSISGHTGAFDTILTAASGQSFQDHASVRTNALRYNQSNGVGFRCTAGAGGYIIMMQCDQARFKMRRLQLNSEDTTNIPISSDGDNTAKEFKDLIINSVNRGGLFLYGAANKAINVLCTFESAPAGGANFGIKLGDQAQAIGCTVVISSDASAGSTGFVTVYSNNILQSCAAFNFSAAASATGWDTTNSKNNAASNASGLPGGSPQHSVTFSQTTPFTDADKDSWDLISIAGTSLIDNGFRDATNAPNDITGTSRAATPTIGHWEVVAAAGGLDIPIAYHHYRTMHAA